MYTLINNIATDIIIKPVKDSKINNVDFSNLPFGKVFSDHIFQCEYIDGTWKNPVIKPNEHILLNPAAKIFHYGQSIFEGMKAYNCLLYTSPSPRDRTRSRMPSSA